MRLLGVLALATPLALGILLLLAMGDSAPSSLDGPVRPVVVALGAGAFGVLLTSLVVAGYFRYRFGALVGAAERIAAGDYATLVHPRRFGLESRLARAINDISSALADTHDRATIDRLTGERATARQALYASKICSYAQGFQMMQAADQEYRWGLTPGSIAMRRPISIRRAVASARSI